MVHHINAPLYLRIPLVLALVLLFFTFQIAFEWLHWLLFTGIALLAITVMHEHQRNESLALYLKISKKMGWKFHAHSKRHRGRAIIEGECRGRKFTLTLAPTGISQTGADTELSFRDARKKSSFVAIPKKHLWGLMWSKRKARSHFERLEKRDGKAVDMPTHNAISDDPKIAEKQGRLEKVFSKEKNLIGNKGRVGNVSQVFKLFRGKVLRQRI